MMKFTGKGGSGQGGYSLGGLWLKFSKILCYSKLLLCSQLCSCNYKCL